MGKREVGQRSNSFSWRLHVIEKPSGATKLVAQSFRRHLSISRSDRKQQETILPVSISFPTSFELHLPAEID
jgi:hypothetical protein